MKHYRIPAVIATIAFTAMLAGCGTSSSPTSPSMSLDTTPPPAPTALAMTMDGPTGSYRLQWAPSPAADLAKYQVYQYAPDPSRDNAYVLLGEATGASYLTTDPTVAATVVFRVQAVDVAGNHSAFSAALTVPMTPTNPLGSGSGGTGMPGSDHDPNRKIAVGD